jgi:Tol biopolymer transport system component
MPDFDTRRPQEQNVPNEPGIGMVANKLRSALMATRLRALLMGGGILLFVVALPVGLLIYSPSWLGAQDQGSSQREVGSRQQTSDEPADMALVSRCADKGSTVGQQDGVGNLLEMLAGLLAEAGVRGREEVSRGEVSNGKIAFLRRNAEDGDDTDIYVIDEEGTHQTRLTATKWTEEGPTWSPDGEKIAFSRFNARDYTDIYVMDADGANQTRLTGTPDSQSSEPLGYPVWSPDGRKIAFVTSYTQTPLAVMNADGTNQTQLQTELFTLSGETTLSLGSPVWSPTGNKLAFGSYTIPDTIADSSAEPAPVEGLTGIYLLNVDGTGLCKLTSTHKLTDPVWSPDGEKIAFADKGAINVINTDGSERQELAAGTSGHSEQPQWSPDGQEMAFVDSSESIYVINADGSERQELAADATERAHYAWSPDGQKLAYFCSGYGVDLCVVNTDGTGWTRLARGVSPEGYPLFASWGSR